MPIIVSAYAARTPLASLMPYTFEYGKLKAREVHIKVKYCGICHTDIHLARGEWGSMSMYPMVPGHEIVGLVEAVGPKVSKFRKGDRAAIGFFRDACRKCERCRFGLEQYCNRVVLTCSDQDREGRLTHGGFASDIVCEERFVLRLPSTLNMASAAPLLCAGVTVWSPIKHFGMDKKGTSIGVIGLGGLGHMVVKFAKAFGAKCTVISTTPDKKKEALEVFGAHDFVVSTDTRAMEEREGTLDFIIDTVSVPKDLDFFMKMLRVEGILVTVGLPSEGLSIELSPTTLIRQRKQIAGSLVGSISDTQKMLNFCAEHNITATIELITMDRINEAFDRIRSNDVRYRFVVDVGASSSPFKAASASISSLLFGCCSQLPFRTDSTSRLFS